MKIKDKQGNKHTFKEFTKKWKDGINGITPLQQIKTQIIGTRIILVGIICGIIICLTSMKTLWWLMIILIGAIFNTYVQYIGLQQKKNMFESFNSGIEEKEVKE